MVTANQWSGPALVSWLSPGPPTAYPILCGRIMPGWELCVLAGSGPSATLYRQALRQGRRWWMSGGMLNLVIAVLVIILLVILILQFV
jgi:hypothetical protein